MTTHHNAAQAANEDTSDLPPPSHRHPMSGEPIWDQHAVRAMLSKLRSPAPAMQEAVLTDAEIREIQGTHLVTVRSRDALIASVIVAGRAIEAAVLSKLRAPVADTLPLEKALYELVNKIDTGLDTGDLLQDARRASTVLDAIMTGGDLVACAHTFFKECGEDKWRERYERSLDFRIGWNACLDAIAEAQANRAALASAPAVKPPPEHFKPPFDNCSFRMCDLPGQCRGEGKCHHPAPTISGASAPVAGEARPTDRQEALRITELPDVDEALATFCSDGTQDNAVGLVLAILSAAPQASAEDVRIRGLEAARFAYASEFAPDENGDPDVGNIHANIRKLKAELANARNAVLEEVAAAVENHQRARRQWIPESLWGRLSGEAAARIRALKTTPAPTAACDHVYHAVTMTPGCSGGPSQAVCAKCGFAPTAAEGGEDDMLTIAYLAGAQAEKERAGDALLAELLDDPLLRDLLGYIEDTGPADLWGAAQAWMAKRNAALAARKEDGNAN